jgi:hypothetical protein
MDDMNNFERQLAAKVVRMAGPDPHFNALEIARTAAAQSPKWRFQSMFSATKFVVAGAIVALFGGFLLSGVLTERGEEVVPAADASVSPVVTDVIDVGGQWSGPIVAAGDAVWVGRGTDFTGSLSRGSVSRIDPVNRQVTDSFAVGSDPSSMVPTADGLWVLGIDGKLSRIDLATRAVTEPFDSTFLPGGSYEMVDPLVIDGSLWAQRGSGSSASLVEIDLAGQDITNEYAWPWSQGADWMAEIDGAIWAWRKWTSRSGVERETLARFDLGTREFTFELDMDNKDLRGGPGCVWRRDLVA